MRGIERLSLEVIGQDTDLIGSAGHVIHRCGIVFTCCRVASSSHFGVVFEGSEDFVCRTMEERYERYPAIRPLQEFGSMNLDVVVHIALLSEL